MTLWLVGLGPAPGLEDLSRRAEAALRGCTEVWLDAVTAGAVDERAGALAALLGRAPRRAQRIDRDERAQLAAAARAGEVALAVAGDPLVATPYRFLLQELRAAGVEVKVVPGISALTAVATAAGLDAALAQVVIVAEPARPSSAELAAIAQSLNARRAVIVLAAGRAPEPDAEAWSSLQARWPGLAERVALDGGGAALVLRPRPTC